MTTPLSTPSSPSSAATLTAADTLHTPEADVPVTSFWHKWHDRFPAVLAGLIAVLISYAGPLLLVLQAGQSAGLSTDQIASWIWAISIGSGVCGVWLSWQHKIPVVCAWNTPGAALPKCAESPSVQAGDE